MSNDYNQELFEKLIVEELDLGYNNKEYALKKDKKGFYVKYETKLAYKWWRLAQIHHFKSLENN